MKILLLLFCSMLLLQSCDLSEAEEELVHAYVPVYRSYDEISDIQLRPDKKLEKSGKIYTIRDMLLISEPGAGVHIFDNSDPSKPVRVNFISIPGNQDMEMRNRVLYADNGLDLVAIDLSDIRNPKVRGRETGVFPYPSYPPLENVKFVCPDPALGYVVDWELKEVSDPKCRR